MKIIVIVSAISLFSLSSCKNGKVGHFFTNNKKYQLTQSVPVAPSNANNKYYYTITNETQTSIDYNDKKSETGGEIKVGLLYELRNDSAGNRLLKMTYDRIHITLNKQEGEQQFDADNASHSDNQIEKILGVIKGSSIVILVNKKGDIVSINGAKEMTDKILGATQNLNEQERKKVQEQISQLAGEAFIKNNLEQGFKLFPNKALAVDDSWTRKETQSAGIQYEALTTYTLESVDDSVAEVTTDAEINTGDGVATELMGVSVTADLKGDQTGNVKVCRTSGIVMNSKSTTFLKGTIQVMGKEVPVKIKVKKEVSSKKL